ncbi:MAG: hypothetical protein DRP88_04225 [Candidatus Neomarinimicrobiota bacterium]|nr:MAG: hypothetical protein DRP88_04225 [Candidatus Neomarinimicrobiota bacterium]
MRNRILLYLILLVIYGCSKNEQIPEDEIVARIGDKVITVGEFIKRSEFTVRPPYCRNNYYIHKKIVLNSLIGEKLLALEAGTENELTMDPNFQAFIEGRKEQAMRQYFYYKEAFEPVKISPEEIRKVYRIAGRRYKVSYFTISDTSLFRKVNFMLQNQKTSFEEVYTAISGDTAVPKKEIRWFDPELPEIHQALFEEQPPKGTILRPFEIEDGKYLFIRVDGWVDRVIISDHAAADRIHMIKEKLKQEKASERYTEIVRKIMHGKKMYFYEDTFKKMVEIFGPIYLVSLKEKKELFNMKFWGKEIPQSSIPNIPKSLDELNHLPFFSVDGEIWTVAEFREYMKRHPLVFRKARLNKRNFANQFKLAIVDMIRDYYITQKAYEKGYDQAPAVKYTVNMWVDHMLALYQKYKYLSSLQVDEKDQVKIVEEYMTPYLDSLQNKYSSIIEINIPIFEKIKLTRVDMIALQLDQPFPIVVPAFPLVTTDNRLDYGKIMGR